MEGGLSLSANSLYLPRDFDKYLLDIERLAAAKKISRNKMFQFILKDWVDNHRRYMDMKISDFEQAEIEEIKKEIPLGCKECGSDKVDDITGLRVHVYGCSWIEARRKSKESLGDE